MSNQSSPSAFSPKTRAGVHESTETMGSQVDELEALGLPEQPGRDVGYHDLPAMGGSHDAGGPVYGGAE